MGRGIGYGFTAAQRQELWDRYQLGESLNAIARALGKTSSSIDNHLRVKRTSIDRLAGTKNPAHGRVLSFRGSGGVLCAVPTIPKRVRVT